MKRCTKDFGAEPFVTDICRSAAQNQNFRTTLWTGKCLQSTLMCINVGEDIGLETHTNTDQFIFIVSGNALVKMGKHKNEFPFCREAHENCAVFVPAGTWHNIINTGSVPLKVFSIYAPPHHPFGTVHRTKKEAEHE